MKEELPFDPADFVPADAAPAVTAAEDELPRGSGTLARFEDNQQGSALLLQYLSEYGVGLL